jgi:hypothetical protein
MKLFISFLLITHSFISFGKLHNNLGQTVDFKSHNEGETGFKSLDTVLFSKSDSCVLMYDFFQQERRSLNIWNLYTSGNIDTVLSIILDDNKYYELNQRLLLDSNKIEKHALNIDSLIDKYGLTIKGVEITEDVQLLETHLNTRDVSVPKDETSKTSTHKIFDLEIKWIYKEDTISTFKIDSIDYLDRITENSRPESVYDEDGELKGWRKDYSAIYKSNNNNHYFIYSTISVSRLDGIFTYKSEEDQSAGSFSSYGLDMHQVLIVK